MLLPGMKRMVGWRIGSWPRESGVCIEFAPHAIEDLAVEVLGGRALVYLGPEMQVCLGGWSDRFTVGVAASADLVEVTRQQGIVPVQRRQPRVRCARR